MKIFSLLLYTAFKTSKRKTALHYSIHDNNVVLICERKDSFDDFLNDKRNDTLLRGCDTRYPKEDNAEELYKISENMNKLELLKKINSSQLSLLTKLDLIESNDHIFDEDSFAPNISKGGLMDDFNFVF